MKRILFIDDIRNVPIKCPKLFVYVARSYYEAIFALKSYTFDEISFDHDLGEEKTGYDVAKYIVENNIKIKNGFRVHSSNPVGKFNISQLLTHYGYQELT